MKSFYIYMFLNEEEEPLYIGQTINLVQRIQRQHFLSDYGNLSEECILKTKRVLYHECLSEEDMKIKERYLINTLSPKFNKSINNNNKFSFSIDIDWKYLPLNREKIIKERKAIIRKKIAKKTVSILIYENDLKELSKWGFFKLHNRIPTNGYFNGWENINLGTSIADGIRLIESKIDLSLIDNLEKPRRRKRKIHRDKIRTSSAQLTEEEIILIKKIIHYRIIIDNIDDFTSCDLYTYLLICLKKEYKEFNNFIIKTKQTENE